MKSFIYSIKLIILIVFSILLISGCKNRDLNTYNKSINSSVLISTHRGLFTSSYGHGSGVIISKDGYILTNYHVVYSADSISVKSDDGLFSSLGSNAKIIKLDKENDLALIKIENKEFSVDKIAQFESPKNIYKGQHIFVVGTPLEKRYYNLILKGIVMNKNTSSYTNLPLLDGTSPSVLINNLTPLDLQTNPGNSGGPVFNSKNGKLIGIISNGTSIKRFSNAISIEQINKFLVGIDITK